jgi:Zn-dependent protease
MMPTENGSFRLFQVAGVQVFIHWSWFVVAIYSINSRKDEYTTLGWNVAEYLALFLIVLLHEFGHTFACRQVGGQANRIVLWPLGGVAFVAPPQRPGAMLWSIAAGPLVNVVLLVLALLAAFAGKLLGWSAANPDLQRFIWMLAFINVGLLIFNLLPIYPLDGGQILRSLLWYWVGRARSLTIATVIGFVGALGLLGWAIVSGSILLGVMALFILFNCWRTWGEARVLEQFEQAPRHNSFACPSCRVAPPAGPFWMCHRCQTRFDTFETGAVCPQCQEQFSATACPQCGAMRPMAEWRQPPAN